METKNVELELAEKIVAILDNRKAADIKLLRVADKTVIADYFVICSGNSSTQVKALCDEVEYRLSELGYQAARTEGLSTGLWIAIDYHSVIIHIFSAEKRKYYNLERLWGEAEEIDISALLDKN